MNRRIVPVGMLLSALLLGGAPDSEGAEEHRIVDPEGRPLDGRAQVVIAVEEAVSPEDRRAHVHIRNGRLAEDSDPVIVMWTRGRFEIPSWVPENWRLVVLHRDGFAEVSQTQFEESRGLIKLTPWGRVAGTVMLGSKPVAEAEVHGWDGGEELSGGERPLIIFSNTTRTDAQGRFALDRVPVGLLKISWSLPPFDKALPRNLYRRDRFVIVDPRRTARMEIKIGEGRTVIGQVVEPEQGARLRSRTPIRLAPHPPAPPARVNEWFGAAWREVFQEIMRRRPDPFPRSERPAGVSLEEWHEQHRKGRQWLRELSDAYDRWRVTDEAKALFEHLASRLSRRELRVLVEEDGSFRIHDVPPGTYRLHPDPFDNFTAHRRTLPDIAKARNLVLKEFTVPEAAPGEEDEPIDIGLVELPPAD